MNLSAAPWSGSLLNLADQTFRFILRPTRFLTTGLLCCLLFSCATTPIDTEFDDDYQQSLGMLEEWSLRGRLNIRSDNQSDTININWLQQGDTYDINLSGTLGLGAVRLSGGPGGVLIEKSGNEPVMASSLEAITTEMLGYAFPVSELLYWVRGLPAPGRQARLERNAEGLIGSLVQADASGFEWTLKYDRFELVDDHPVPGRIRLEQSPYRLTLLINNWELP